MRVSTTFLYICCASIAAGQSFLTAISAYPQLSNFTALIQNNTSLASTLLNGSASALQTVLVPNNTAFANYQSLTGTPISSLSSAELEPILSYHILVGQLTTPDFSQPQGLTAPSLLVGGQYDNRSAGAGLSSVGGSTSASHDGQVVFISASAGLTNTSSPTSMVESGLGNTVNLTALDGTWDGGRFQMVDGFLTLPNTCTQTIRANGLSSLDASLNRTGLSSVLDHINNVTCLGPSNAAFLAAGSPDTKANVSDLTAALLFHTIPVPLYTNFLVDGQTFQTANNQTVRVSLINGAIFFNDAMVTKPNVITNNGLIHQLDRVMSPLSSTSSQSSAPTSATTSSGSTSATSSPASGTGNVPSTTAPTSAPATPTSAASSDNSLPRGWGITGLLGIAFFFLL